jgi:glycosyltransferase involved in cell wall biosynthesis
LKPKILLITIQPPRMPGIGGEVRTFNFLKAATEIGDVTVISLGGPGGNIPTSDSLARKCTQVIQPSVSAKNPKAGVLKSRLRLASWFRMLRAFVFPWQDEWQNFLELCVQHCLPNCNETQRRPFRKRTLAALLNTELGVLSRFCSVPPLTAFAYTGPFKQIRDAAIATVNEQHFDLIWIEHTLTHHFAVKILDVMREKSVPVLLNSQNIEFEVCSRVAAVSKTRMTRKFWINQARLTRQLEQNAYNAADMVIQCSEKDIELARQTFQHTHQVVAGNGVDTDYFRPNGTNGRAPDPTAVFTGGFGYHPNQEAVAFFVGEILPLIRSKVANCRFIFAGSQADELRHVIPVGCDYIDIYNSPEDIRPIFEKAWVYVVPLRAGGGTRLKVLEAMAMERAIVSTSLGAEGIPCEDGRHLILANTPQDFAGCVVSLLQNDAARTTLESNAAEWVRRNYSWTQICDRAKDQVLEIL